MNIKDGEAERSGSRGCLACYVIFGAFIVWFLLIRDPGYMTTTRGLVVDMKGKIDVDDVNAWLSKYGVSKSALHKDHLDNDTVPLPKSIQALPRGSVYVHDDKWMTIYWGSGFGHWGLEIGPKGMLPPANKSRYYLPVEDGVTAWHDLQ